LTAQEKRQEFGEMVRGAERLARPWKIALLVSNIIWAVLLAVVITVAYIPAHSAPSAAPAAVETGD
jgi:hypothetical protein